MSLTSQDWIGSLERPLPTALTLISYLSGLFSVWTFTPADIRGVKYWSARLCLGIFHEEMFDGSLRYLAVGNSPCVRQPHFKGLSNLSCVLQFPLRLTLKLYLPVLRSVCHHH